MQESKSIFTSVTFWGVVISIISKIASLSGYDLPIEGLDVLLAGFIGDALSIWGRVRATKKVEVVKSAEVVTPEVK